MAAMVERIEIAASQPSLLVPDLLVSCFLASWLRWSFAVSFMCSFLSELRGKLQTNKLMGKYVEELCQIFVRCKMWPLGGDVPDEFRANARSIVRLTVVQGLGNRGCCRVFQPASNPMHRQGVPIAEAPKVERRKMAQDGARWRKIEQGQADAKQQFRHGRLLYPPQEKTLE